MSLPASASLPSPSIFPWKYDVFLSFRGEDTRGVFLSHLYHELQIVNGIQTFKDDTQLEVGEPISPSLLKAIEESRLAIVVLSENYASSSWCLEELTKISQCMVDDNRILPLFYRVNPSDVRKQNGSFEKAFTKHENDGKVDGEKMEQWRKALAKVANFSGWHTQNYKSDRELLDAIVKTVRSKVKAAEIEITYGEKKIRLPRFGVWKAKYNNKYLRLTKNDPALEGFIKFDGNEAMSPLAKFELQMAKRGNRLVHIRCCYNNKYLVRSNTSRWIVAAAANPEETESKISCTLFELEPVDKNGGLDFRFRHVQMRMYACLYMVENSFYGGLSGCSDVPDKDDCDVYTLVDGESANKTNKAVVLPKFVALKATYNSKYLSLTTNDSALPAGFIKFDGNEVMSPQAKFEIEMAKGWNGLVHIRSCDNNKYLVKYDCNWIIAAADKPEDDESDISCTLFKPEPYDESGGQNFRFRHVQLGLYACLWRAKLPFYGGLYGGSNAPDKDECDVYTVVNWELANKANKASKEVELPRFVESRFVAFKAMDNNKYLRLTKNDPALPAGFIKFDGNVAMSPQAKFEVEMAKSLNGLVHIRCCCNNKYLVRTMDNNHNWIVAAADKPEEDGSKISCTLFEPEPYDESEEQNFRFRHVQLGMYACLWRAEIPFYGGLYGGSGRPDRDACDVYTVVNWKTPNKTDKVVVLPRFVALKATYNNKYLSLITNDPALPAGFIKFEGNDSESPQAKFEIEKAKGWNGLVHIRCCYNNKYLVRHDHNWIVAAAEKPEEDEYEISCTLFEPESYGETGGQNFRFRHVHLGMYACLWRAKLPFYGGLYGGSNAPDKDECDVYTVVSIDIHGNDEGCSSEKAIDLQKAFNKIDIHANGNENEMHGGTSESGFD